MPPSLASLATFTLLTSVSLDRLANDGKTRKAVLRTKATASPSVNTLQMAVMAMLNQMLLHRSDERAIPVWALCLEVWQP